MKLNFACISWRCLQFYQYNSSCSGGVTCFPPYKLWWVGGWTGNGEKEWFVYQFCSV